MAVPSRASRCKFPAIKAAEINLWQAPTRAVSRVSVPYDPDPTTSARITMLAVRPGSYHLSADHDAGVPDGADLVVKLDGPANVTIPLRWPSVAPILVRSLKGTIHTPDQLPGSPQPRLALDLLEGASGHTLKSLETTESGEFSLEGAAPGLYFLNLRPSGLIAVAVDNAARADRLDLDIGWTSCGLWYADRSMCPRSDLRIEKLSGQVTDASGAAISDARILLFDRTETLVDELRSDSAGKFASPGPWDGPYELVVTSAGFTPLRTTVHMERRGNSSLLSPLAVQLGVGGACSVANSQ